jgi:hypothetical protein
MDLCRKTTSCDQEITLQGDKDFEHISEKKKILIVKPTNAYNFSYILQLRGKVNCEGRSSTWSRLSKVAPATTLYDSCLIMELWWKNKVGLIPTHPFGIPCGRKQEYPENTHDCRQSVDRLFSRKCQLPPLPKQCGGSRLPFLPELHALRTSCVFHMNWNWKLFLNNLAHIWIWIPLRNVTNQFPPISEKK